MSRLTLLNVDDMTLDQRAQYDRFPSNLTRGLLLLDQRLSAAAPNLANAIRAASLDAKTREAVILRVAALHSSAYERLQHLEQARTLGWSDAEIASIEAGEPPPGMAALLGFVDECVRNGDVSDTTFSAVRANLSPGDIATLILLIGHYMMVARFTRVLRIELDAKAECWSQEH